MHPYYAHIYQTRAQLLKCLLYTRPIHHVQRLFAQPKVNKQHAKPLPADLGGPCGAREPVTWVFVLGKPVEVGEPVLGVSENEVKYIHT